MDIQDKGAGRGTKRGAKAGREFQRQPHARLGADQERAISFTFVCHSSLGFTPVRKSWPDTTQAPTHTQTHTHTRIHDQQEVRCIKDSEISSMQPQDVTNRAFSSCNDLRHTVRALEADGSGGRKEVR